MSEILSPRFEEFYATHGVHPPFKAEPIRAGRNSEVQRLSNRDGQWIVKHYFHHANDQRDRLGTEFGFLQFFNQYGMANLPRAVGMDRELNCALYSLLPGSRPKKMEASHINQAAAFILELQRFRKMDGATQLPLAADACLSWQKHFDILACRIERLLQINPDSELKSAAYKFVRDTLAPAWQRLLEKLLNGIAVEQRQAILAQEERILSPSDFGFHNALEFEQHISFVDFEYAGWDDPAKLICDFISQPEVPITPEQGRQFNDAILAGLHDDGAIAHRVTQLLPLHRLKWCCILLNEFRNEDLQRRQHAGVNGSDLLEIQLQKARTYFDTHLIQYSWASAQE